MSILTKVLLGLALVAIFPVLYLSAGVLNVNHAWRTKVEAFRAAVAAEEKALDDIEHGDFVARAAKLIPGMPEVGKTGVEQRRTVRDLLRARHGRVWYATRDAATIDEAAGTVTMRIFDGNLAGPSPLKEHGITDKSFLYVFQLKHDGTPNPGQDRYVGEFVVNGLTVDATSKLPADEKVPVKPSLPMGAEEWEAMRNGSGDWVVYDSMPADLRNPFLGLTDNEIRQRVPEAVAEEFIADDKPPTDAVRANPVLSQYVQKVTDEKGNTTEKFLRPLRDYRQYFRDVAARSTELFDRITVLKKEQEYSLRALARTEDAKKALDLRKAQLDAELQALNRETAVAQAQVARLDAGVVQLRKELQDQLIANKRLLEAAAGQKTAALDRPAAIAVP